MFLRNIQYPFFAPETAVPSTGGGSTSGTQSDLSKDDILDYLNKDDTDDDNKEIIPLDDDRKPEKKAKEDKEDDVEDDKDEEEEEDEVEDPLKALEDELEEPGEEKLELQTPTSRREILKKYPKLFKDFPYLETAYYREQEFTKLLPTIDDAREAVEKSKVLDNFESDLSGGNTEEILQAVKKESPKGFTKIVDNYLETLGKVDREAQLHVISNLTKSTIMNMVRAARESNNEVLEQAAVILNQWAFGTSRWQEPTKLTVEETKVDDGRAEIEKEKKAIQRQRYETANTELTTKLSKAFKATIENKIDPKDSMSEYVKRQAVREANENLEQLMSKDTRFKTLVDRLWENAFKNGFDDASKAKLRQAFVSKAQTLLPSVISKARNEALRGIGKRVKDDDSRQDDESKDGQEAGRKRASKTGDESHPRNDSGSKSKVPDGMTALEYLMAD